MEFWSGIGDATAAEEWAADQLLNNPSPHQDVHELLFKQSMGEIEQLLLRIARDQEGFEPISELGEKEAIDILVGACEKLISEEITPSHFCHIVRTYDGNYGDFKKIDAHTFEYPKWLGDLWNSCDWCDESWTNSNAPHLVAEAKNILMKNARAKDA